MFITKKDELQKYSTEYRIWQGIPGIELTKKGRMFATFYSGGTKEELDNYVMLVYSNDGEHFTEPVAVAYKKGYRCFDPCLWIDPLGRLWFTWSMIPDHGTYAAVCDNPDADELIWHDVVFVGHDVMMNKPTVLTTGEWMFPIAVWHDDVRVLSTEFDTKETDKRAFVYKSIDNGRSFEKLGGVNAKERSFDEHMILELSDGRLAMYIRTHYGIAVAYSYDGGRNWTEGTDSGLGGPDSRFFIRRLPSGRILLINHENAKERNNLTAYLSEDDGKTWPHRLLLDERMNVSYPDGVLDSDGFIYIIYDRERGVLKKKLAEAYECAREILYAKFTEEDIIAGELMNANSKLRCVVSKLGEYAETNKNPYHETERYSKEELAQFILKHNSQDALETLLELYPARYMNMTRKQRKRFDLLADAIGKETQKKKEVLIELIALLRSVPENQMEGTPIVETVKRLLSEDFQEDMTIEDLAERAGISAFYLMHLFKKETGTTIVAYKRELRIAYAKKLLVQTQTPISDIALRCGYSNPSYFSKMFIQSEGVSPAQYRKLLGNQ